MSVRTALKALLGTAWHVQGDAVVDQMTPATDGTVDASKPIVADANKDIGVFRNVGISGQIQDANGNELIKLTTTASAVNEITVENQATGVSPRVQATGGDTNVGLRLDAKGTAYVGLDDPLVENHGAAFSDNTAGAVTYTAAQVLAGIIVRDPNGAGRTDVLPTAALLVAAIPGAKVGDTVRCKVINGADAAETITIAAGSGGGFDTLQIAATRIVPQNTSRDVLIRLTNVTASSEAYVAYM